MVEGVAVNAGGLARYAVADNGSLVYVPALGGGSLTRTLALVGPSGEVEPLNVPPAPYLSPRLSPDGAKLVVQTAEEDGGVLWLYDLAGNTQIQQLTFDGDGDNQNPIWTPDSQRITFSSDREGTMSLYSMPADRSGAAEPLTTADEGTRHWPGSWAPDGQTLLFNVERDQTTDWDIWTLSANGRETQSLYDTPDTIYLGAELSPNGQWLAYGSGPDVLNVDIYIDPFPPTGSKHKITQNGGYFPLWSPDGDRLFHRPVSTFGEVTLRSVDVVTQPVLRSAMSRRCPSKGSRWWVFTRDYDISPDGERLVMVFPADLSERGEASPPQINVVTNWFEELTERVPVP